MFKHKLTINNEMENASKLHPRFLATGHDFGKRNVAYLWVFTVTMLSGLLTGVTGSNPAL